MYESRRSLLRGMAGVVAGSVDGRFRCPRAGPVPQGAYTTPALVKTNRLRIRMAKSPAKVRLEENQKDIKKDIEKLFDLASQLKQQVEKTDATAVLSLAMVKKAEEIERLARQIKERAKG